MTNSYPPKLTILRLRSKSDGDQGCFGIAYNYHGRPFCVTLEHCFADPKSPYGRLVIPAGISRAVADTYNAAKPPYKTFEIIVHGHTEVKIHKLNVMQQSKGCIGLGESFAQFQPGALPVLDAEQTGIAQSGEAFREFMFYYGSYPEIQVEVKEHIPNE